MSPQSDLGCMSHTLWHQEDQLVVPLGTRCTSGEHHITKVTHSTICAHRAINWCAAQSTSITFCGAGAASHVAVWTCLARCLGHNVGEFARNTVFARLVRRGLPLPSYTRIAFFGSLSGSNIPGFACVARDGTGIGCSVTFSAQGALRCKPGN